MFQILYVIVCTVLFVLWIPFVYMTSQLIQKEYTKENTEVASKVIILILISATIFMLSHFIWTLRILF